MEIFNAVTFAESDDGTRMVLRGRPIRATAAEHAFFAGMHPSMQGGFGGTFAQLVEWLASAR